MKKINNITILIKQFHAANNTGNLSKLNKTTLCEVINYYNNAILSRKMLLSKFLLRTSNNTILKLKQQIQDLDSLIETRLIRFKDNPQNMLKDDLITLSKHLNVIHNCWDDCYNLYIGEKELTKAQERESYARLVLTNSYKDFDMTSYTDFYPKKPRK